MLVQRSERAVGAVAQVALVPTAVPRRIGGIVGNLLRGVAVGEKAGGIGDHILLVVASNVLVDYASIDA